MRSRGICCCNTSSWTARPRPRWARAVFAGCDYLYDIDLYAHGTKQQMLDWQAYVDALGIPCRVWRAQDPTAESLESGAYQYENLMLTEYTGA